MLERSEWQFSMGQQFALDVLSVVGRKQGWLTDARFFCFNPSNSVTKAVTPV
jgi:hypothetical protein